MAIEAATDEFNPRAEADVSYTIVINARQLHYLQLAMAQFVSEDPGWEADECGQDIPTVLEEMLSGRDEALAPSPAINSFVL